MARRLGPLHRISAERKNSRRRQCRWRADHGRHVPDPLQSASRTGSFHAAANPSRNHLGTLPRYPLPGNLQTPQHASAPFLSTDPALPGSIPRNRPFLTRARQQAGPDVSEQQPEIPRSRRSTEPRAPASGSRPVRTATRNRPFPTEEHRAARASKRVSTCLNSNPKSPLPDGAPSRARQQAGPDVSEQQREIAPSRRSTEPRAPASGSRRVPTATRNRPFPTEHRTARASKRALTCPNSNAKSPPPRRSTEPRAPASGP